MGDECLFTGTRRERPELPVVFGDSGSSVVQLFTAGRFGRARLANNIVL